MRFNRLLAATVACSIALGSTSFAAKIAKSTNSATTSEVTTEVTTVDSESTEATTMVDELSTETVSEETTEATTEATTETTTVNPFSDVDSSSAQGNAILKMYAKGLLSGYNDGTFKPDNNITRAEVARVFNNVFGYTLNSSATITDFTDNTDSSVWYYNDVRIAQSNGYINGFNDGSFQPKANMTREQACTIIYLAGKLPAPTTEAGITDLVSAWAKNAVEANIAEGVFTLEAGNTFRATANITRGELCEALAHFVTDDADAITTATTTVAASSESTTESTTTETTTKSSTSGSTGGGGGGGGGGGSSSSGSSTTTETTTESTTQDLSGITLDDA